MEDLSFLNDSWMNMVPKKENKNNKKHDRRITYMKYNMVESTSGMYPLQGNLYFGNNQAILGTKP